MDEFVSVFNSRLNSSILKNNTLTEEELTKLGKKDSERYVVCLCCALYDVSPICVFRAVEEFIEKNCVKITDDKWLCPLSQKKFKGPEFVHKHLQTKYAEQIEEVKNEVGILLFPYSRQIIILLSSYRQCSTIISSSTPSARRTLS